MLIIGGIALFSLFILALCKAGYNENAENNE